MLTESNAPHPPPLAGAGNLPVRTRWWASNSGREALEAYLLLLPWLVGITVFVAYPVLYSLYLSFTHYPILASPTWIGLGNYEELFFKDRLFWKSLQVTATYSLVAVPSGVIVGYAVALFLNQKVRGLSLWRTMYFVPSIVPAIAAAYLWAWVFNAEWGVFNGLLRLAGIRGPNWFNSEQWVLPAFIIMHLWGAGGGLVLYLAALQGVPTALYEAATIDGANAWQRFRNVTLPMTSPVVLFTFLTGIIGSFQVFTAGYVITNGGPNNASLFYILYLFRNGWEFFKMGYAAALAWMLLLIILALTGATLFVSRRMVYYEYDGRER